MHGTTGSAAAPAARCKNCLRVGSFIFKPPFTSFDHLVGAAGQGQRDGDAERLGGLEVEDQLDFGGLHHREVSRLLPFENAPGVETGQTVRLRNAASVAHQTAGGSELALKIDRWNPVAEGECAELCGVAAEQWIGGADHERGFSQLRRRCEGRFEVSFGARVEYMKPYAECIGYGLQVFRNRRSEWICGLTSSAKVVAPGNSSCASSSRFRQSSALN